MARRLAVPPVLSQLRVARARPVHGGGDAQRDHRRYVECQHHERNARALLEACEAHKSENDENERCTDEGREGERNFAGKVGGGCGRGYYGGGGEVEKQQGRAEESEGLAGYVQSVEPVTFIAKEGRSKGTCMSMARH